MAAAAYKVMLLGEIGVGKSSLARRVVFDRFSKDYKPTIGVEVYRYNVALGDAGTETSLILWDTDGNFGDAIFRHVYIKQASAAFIVGDQSRPETIDSMIRLAKGFGDVFPGRFIHFILNKSDLIDARSGAALEERLGRGGMKVTHTSALLGDQVAQAFITTAQEIVRRDC